MKIHHAIQSGQYPNAQTLARQLEVSTKSIHRDLDFMRDRLDLPLEYNPSRFGYYYWEEVGAFPTLQLTEGELFALLVAEKALQQYRGTHFEKPLLSAFRKMAASLPETISLHLPDWDQTISFHTRVEPILKLEVFDQIARATAERRRLLLSYRKPGVKEVEPRRVDPYHLANINGEWFLFAYCHLRLDIRTFVPSRIQRAQILKETFHRPKNFSVDRTLKDSFGVIAGQGDYDVVVQFQETVADYIREKRWHPSQKLVELPDGSVELRMRLSSLAEVQRWLLGWSGHAEVKAPAELVKAMRESARRILSTHREASS